MDDFNAPFCYNTGAEQLEQIVLNHNDVSVDNFDFDLFSDFVATNSDLTAVPTDPMLFSYDEAGHEDLQIPLGAPPQGEWETEQILNVPPTPVRFPEMSRLSQGGSQIPMPTPAALNIDRNYQPQPYQPQQREQRVGMGYLNSILNSFSDPSHALRVIDRIQPPFAQGLQDALERELNLRRPFAYPDIWTQRDQGYQAPSNHGLPNDLHALPVPLSYIPQQAPPVRRTREASPESSMAGPSTRKRAYNKRPANIRNFNPAAFYTPLSQTTAPWGQGPYPGEMLFHYTPLGELNPTSTYSVEDIITYIQYHPLNNYANNSRGLTLWVQVTPADSGKRYGSLKSDKCRFACCPDPQRTIRKGDFRIAFDEQHSQGQNTDPFHNAGYTHLYCMEKFLDFPSICRSYNVRPDTRQLKEGKNKMAITRDHASMQDIAANFIQNARPWNEFGDGTRPEEYYEHTLCYQLTIEHLAQQPSHVQRIRERRAGNSIDSHLNNLDRYLAIREELENQRKAQSKSNTRPRGSKKRKPDGDDGEDQLDNDKSSLSGEGEDDDKVYKGKSRSEEQSSSRKIKRPRRR